MRENGRPDRESRRRSRLPTLCLLMLAAATARADELRPGVVYPGGSLVEVAEYGLSLTVPQGWQGALAPNGELFVMQSADGALLVSADETSLEEARAELAAPMDLGDGLVLVPSGAVEEGQGFLAVDGQVTGAGRPLVGHLRAVVRPEGLGVAILALTPPEALASGRRWVAEVAGSLAFSAATAPPTAEGGAQAGGSGASEDRWDTYLAGMYLARYYTTSGFTSERHLWLCSDGSFAYSDQSGGFGGGASGAFQGAWGGRWTATGTGNHGALTLHYNDGSVAEYSLEYRDDKLLLDGQRWLRGTNERCR